MTMYKITLSTTKTGIPIYTGREALHITSLLRDPEVASDEIIFCTNGYFKKSHFSLMTRMPNENTEFPSKDPQEFVSLMEEVKKQDPKLAEKYKKLLE